MRKLLAPVRLVERGLVALVVALVRFYQRWVSPLLPPSCRFSPTCSQYMIEAVQKKGLVVGLLKGVWRVVRCNPLCRGGYDPVR